MRTKVIRLFYYSATYLLLCSPYACVVIPLFIAVTYLIVTLLLNYADRGRCLQKGLLIPQPC